MKKIITGFLFGAVAFAMASFPCKGCETLEVGEYGRPFVVETGEDIAEEEKLGDMELIAQLVEAEAGNQDLEGKRLVVDVILNRVADPRFPDTVEGVIFQDKQFSVVKNGAWEKAAYNMKESDYEAVELEYYGDRLNSEILYFNNCSKVSGTGTPFKVGGHYFNS